MGRTILHPCAGGGSHRSGGHLSGTARKISTSWSSNGPGPIPIQGSTPGRDMTHVPRIGVTWTWRIPFRSGDATVPSLSLNTLTLAQFYSSRRSQYQTANPMSAAPSARKMPASMNWSGHRCDSGWYSIRFVIPFALKHDVNASFCA